MAQTGNGSAKGWQMALRRPFQWLDTVLNWLERSVLIVSILAMAAISIANVIARNLGASLTFANEVAQVLLVVVTFVGVGHGVREGRHIRVSAIHDVLPAKGRKILLLITSFTTSVLLLVLAKYSIDYVQKLATTGRILPSLQMPLYFAYSVVPLGLLVGSAQFFLAGVRNLLSPDNYLSWHHKDEYEMPEDAQSANRSYDESHPDQGQ